MKSLPQRIMEHAEAMPEATPICPAALLHLGQRAAVGQALSRLARSGRLMRICDGGLRLSRAPPHHLTSPLLKTLNWPLYRYANPSMTVNAG